MCVNRDIEHEFAVWALRFIDKFERLLKPG
jgi:hypothetical protein